MAGIRRFQAQSIAYWLGQLNDIIVRENFPALEVQKCFATLARCQEQLLLHGEHDSVIRKYRNKDITDLINITTVPASAWAQ